MYKITWDKETGGILLNLRVAEDTLSVSPRPVFFEELDMLCLEQKGWSYPRCEEPLMWACNKQYFYRGQLVFEVSGANIYDAPTVSFQKGCERMTLIPVDVEAMLSRNKDPMFLIESEAIDFIRDTYLAYSAATKSVERVDANKIDFEALTEKLEKKNKQKMAIVKQDCDSFDVMPLETAQEQGIRVFQTTKIDFFLASFSGGKDSQVVLDLCTRAIPPSEFQVIYSDTGYELPSSLALYEDVQKYYAKKFPDLKFSVARNHASVLDYWDKIGTPTDTHRWCCSIMKTAPLYRTFKLPGTNKQGKVLTFDGVRAEESTKRAQYERFGKGKHSNIYNGHPILLWNTAEIFLYLFRHNLPINVAYRNGETRVGCLICPFANPWNDMIVRRTYPDEMKPFVDRICLWSKDFGVNDPAVFLKDGKWQIKAVGNKSAIKTNVEFGQTGTKFTARVTDPNFSLYTWFQTIGDFSVIKKGNIERGELKYKDNILTFEVRHSDTKNSLTFTLDNCLDNRLLYYLKRAIYKAAYCVQCEVCEVDCPTGALTILPTLNIDKSKCIRCHKCLESHDRGCIATDCIRMIKDSDKNATAKIQAYKNFGLHEDWINEFFSDTDGFWENNSLGTAQVDGFRMWLKHAEIIIDKDKLTPFGEILKDVYVNDVNLLWELITTNLSYNSFVIKWFANNIQVGQSYDKNYIVDKIIEQGVDATSTTVKNSVGALFQTINYSPIGSILNYGEPDGSTYTRKTYEDISDIGLAYSLYKFADNCGIRSLRVSDFYSTECNFGPYKVLSVARSTFEKVLRSLNSANNRVLIAELNMGLDNISLRDDLDSISLLKTLIK